MDWVNILKIAEVAFGAASWLLVLLLGLGLLASLLALMTTAYPPSFSYLWRYWWFKTFWWVGLVVVLSGVVHHFMPTVPPN